MNSRPAQAILVAFQSQCFVNVMLRLHYRCGFAGRVAIIRRATSEPIFAVRREQRVKVGATFF
jgi:hypothetical protein